MAMCKAKKPLRGYGYVACCKLAVRDGYCGTHHPDAVARRLEKYRERQKAWLTRSTT